MPKKVSKKTSSRLTKEQKIQNALDDAMPFGVKAGLHQDPMAAEGAHNAGGSFSRTANQSLIGNSLQGGSGGLQAPFVGRTPLLYVDPMFDPILFLFPKDRVDEINKRLRHYYETDPIVGSAIDMHTSFPLSDFQLECEDDEVQQYWNDFKDRTGLLEYLRNMVHDYWLLGEGVGLPIWDEYNFEFSHFNQYPPENIDIVQSYVTPKKYFMLKPDPRLRDKINSGSALDETLSKMMDPGYLNALKEGKPYLMGSDDKVMYLARQTTKYRNRGVSLLSRVLKDLLYKDKLRLLQLTFVDRHMFPIKIFKLGSETRGWIPSKAHFERLDQLLKQASNDPDFSIIYHFGLQVDYVGTKDKIWNLIPEFDFVQKQVMAGLFVNDEIIHGGMPSAVRDTVSMRTLMYRYLDVREKIERMMTTHIFLPIARARGFYRKSKIKQAIAQEKMLKQAKRSGEVPGSYMDDNKSLFRVANSRSGALDLSVYDLPRPIWKKMNLVNNIAEQQLMMQLEEAGKVPLESLLDMLGLDPRVVRAKIKEQESTEFDPLWRSVREDIGKSKQVHRQVLKGRKHGEWELKQGEEIETAPSGPGQAPGKKPPPMSPGAPGMPAKKPATPPPPGAPGLPGSPVGKPPLNVPPPAAGTPPPSISPPPPISPTGPAPGTD